ncbi:titin-like [Ornithodoros turicata]|uniref:titin-like n=1 Tax=Ornithodoros turicata TaxID=34597 RepID=UPI0031390174
MDPTRTPESCPGSAQSRNRSGVYSGRGRARVLSKAESSEPQGMQLAHREQHRLSMQPITSEQNSVLNIAKRKQTLCSNLSASCKIAGIDNISYPRAAKKKCDKFLNIKLLEGSDFGSVLDASVYKYACSEFSVTPATEDMIASTCDALETFRTDLNIDVSLEPSITIADLAEVTRSLDIPVDAPTSKPGVGVPPSKNETPQGIRTTQFLKGVRRKLVVDTVTKTVTERNEWAKTVTNLNTGMEQKDVRVESKINKEEHCKREEEVIESYCTRASIIPESATTATFPIAEVVSTPAEAPPTLFYTDSTGDSQTWTLARESIPRLSAVSHPAVEVPPVSAKPKEEAVPSVRGTSLETSARPILKPPVEQRRSEDKSRRLGFQEVEEKPPEVQKKEVIADEDEELSEPPPSRFSKMRRKDSIAVTKLRLMKETPAEDEELDEEESEPEDGQKRPIFMAPIIISLGASEPTSAGDISPATASPQEPTKGVEEVDVTRKVTQAKEVVTEGTKLPEEQGKAEPAEKAVTPSEHVIEKLAELEATKAAGAALKEVTEKVAGRPPEVEPEEGIEKVPKKVAGEPVEVVPVEEAERVPEKTAEKPTEVKEVKGAVALPEEVAGKPAEVGPVEEAEKLPEKVVKKPAEAGPAEEAEKLPEKVAEKPAGLGPVEEAQKPPEKVADKITEVEPVVEAEKLPEKVAEQPAEAGPAEEAEKLPEKVAEKPAEVVPVEEAEKPSEKVAEKPTEVKPIGEAEKLPEKVAEQPATARPAEEVEKPPGKVAEKPTEVEPVGEAEKLPEKVAEQPAEAGPAEEAEKPSEKVAEKPTVVEPVGEAEKLLEKAAEKPTEIEPVGEAEKLPEKETEKPTEVGPTEEAEKLPEKVSEKPAEVRPVEEAKQLPEKVAEEPTEVEPVGEVEKLPETVAEQPAEARPAAEAEKPPRKLTEKPTEEEPVEGAEGVVEKVIEKPADVEPPEKVAALRDHDRREQAETEPSKQAVAALQEAVAEKRVGLEPVKKAAVHPEARAGKPDEVETTKAEVTPKRQVVTEKVTGVLPDVRPVKELVAHYEKVMASPAEKSLEKRGLVVPYTEFGALIEKATEDVIPVEPLKFALVAAEEAAQAETIDQTKVAAEKATEVLYEAEKFTQEMTKEKEAVTDNSLVEISENLNEVQPKIEYPLPVERSEQPIAIIAEESLVETTPEEVVSRPTEDGRVEALKTTEQLREVQPEPEQTELAGGVSEEPVTFPTETTADGTKAVVQELTRRPSMVAHMLLPRITIQPLDLHEVEQAKVPMEKMPRAEITTEERETVVGEVTGKPTDLQPVEQAATTVEKMPSEVTTEEIETIVKGVTRKPSMVAHMLLREPTEKPIGLQVAEQAEVPVEKTHEVPPTIKAEVTTEKIETVVKQVTRKPSMVAHMLLPEPTEKPTGLQLTEKAEGPVEKIPEVPPTVPAEVTTEEIETVVKEVTRKPSMVAHMLLLEPTEKPTGLQLAEKAEAPVEKILEVPPTVPAEVTTEEIETVVKEVTRKPSMVAHMLLLEPTEKPTGLQLAEKAEAPVEKIHEVPPTVPAEVTTEEIETVVKEVTRKPSMVAHMLLLEPTEKPMGLQLAEKAEAPVEKIPEVPPTVPAEVTTEEIETVVKEVTRKPSMVAHMLLPEPTEKPTGLQLAVKAEAPVKKIHEVPPTVPAEVTTEEMETVVKEVTRKPSMVAHMLLPEPTEKPTGLQLAEKAEAPVEKIHEVPPTVPAEVTTEEMETVVKEVTRKPSMVAHMLLLEPTEKPTGLQLAEKAEAPVEKIPEVPPTVPAEVTTEEIETVVKEVTRKPSMVAHMLLPEPTEKPTGLQLAEKAEAPVEKIHEVPPTVPAEATTEEIETVVKEVTRKPSMVAHMLLPEPTEKPTGLQLAEKAEAPVEKIHEVPPTVPAEAKTEEIEIVVKEVTRKPSMVAHMLLLEPTEKPMGLQLAEKAEAPVEKIHEVPPTVPAEVTTEEMETVVKEVTRKPSMVAHMLLLEPTEKPTGLQLAEKVEAPVEKIPEVPPTVSAKVTTEEIETILKEATRKPSMVAHMLLPEPTEKPTALQLVEEAGAPLEKIPEVRPTVPAEVAMEELEEVVKEVTRKPSMVAHMVLPEPIEKPTGLQLAEKAEAPMEKTPEVPPTVPAEVTMEEIETTAKDVTRKPSMVAHMLLAGTAEEPTDLQPVERRPEVYPSGPAEMTAQEGETAIKEKAEEKVPEIPVAGIADFTKDEKVTKEVARKPSEVAHMVVVQISEEHKELEPSNEVQGPVLSVPGERAEAASQEEMLKMERTGYEIAANMMLVERKPTGETEIVAVQEGRMIEQPTLEVAEARVPDIQHKRETVMEPSVKEPTPESVPVESVTEGTTQPTEETDQMRKTPVYEVHEPAEAQAVPHLELSLETALVEIRPEHVAPVLEEGISEHPLEDIVKHVVHVELLQKEGEKQEDQRVPAARALVEVPTTTIVEEPSKQDITTEILKKPPEKILKDEAAKGIPTKKVSQEAEEIAKMTEKIPTEEEKPSEVLHGTPPLMLTYSPILPPVIAEQEPVIAERVQIISEQEPLLPPPTPEIPHAEPSRTTQEEKARVPPVEEAPLTLPSPEAKPSLPREVKTFEETEPRPPDLGEERPSEEPMRAPPLHIAESLSEPRPQLLEEPEMPEIIPAITYEPFQVSPSELGAEPKGKAEQTEDAQQPAGSSDFTIERDIGDIAGLSHAELIEVALERPHKTRSVKEVRNVESSFMTSEVREVIHYPHHKVTRTHISETKVVRETRSYSELLVEPNSGETQPTNDSQASGPAPPEPTAPILVSQDKRRQVKTMSEQSMSGGPTDAATRRHQKMLSMEQSSLSEELRESENFRSASLSLLGLRRASDFYEFSNRGKQLSMRSSIETSSDFMPLDYVATLPRQTPKAGLPTCQEEVVDACFNVSELDKLEHFEDWTGGSLMSSSAVPLSRGVIPRYLGSMFACSEVSKASEFTELSETRCVTEELHRRIGDAASDQKQN